MRRLTDIRFLVFLATGAAFFAPWTSSLLRLPLQLKIAEAIAIIFIFFLTLRGLLRARIYLPPGTLPLLGVLAVSIVSLLFSPAPAESGFEWAHGVYQPGLYNLTILARQTFYLLLYIAIVNLCTKEHSIVVLLRYFIIGGVIVAIVGLGQATLYWLGKSTAGVYVVPWAPVPRVLGTFNEPSPYSNYLATVAVLLVASLLFDLPMFTKRKSYMFLIAVTSAILVSFSSRGVYEIILGTGYLLFFAKRRVKTLVKVLVIGCLVVLILMVACPNSFKGLLWTFSKVRPELRLSRSESYGGRNAGVYVAPLMFLNKPFFGIGIGNYPFLRNDFGQMAGVPRVSHRDLPNNIYLQFLAETGLVGFALMVYFFVRVFFYTMDSSRGFCGTRAGLYRGLKAVYLITLFDFLFSSALYSCHVWLALGLLVDCARRGHASRLNRRVCRSFVKRQNPSASETTLG